MTLSHLPLYFFSFPDRYCNLTLPQKLPPITTAMPARELPLPGYLEQTVAYALRTALAMTAEFRPKHPFVTPERSALIYTALQLKGGWHIFYAVSILNPEASLNLC